MIHAAGEEWALVTKGCIQSIELKNLTLESAERGILFDANRAGVTISLDGVWNFDARREHNPPELLCVEAVSGLSIRNVMGLDSPSVITFSGSKNVNQVSLESVQAKRSGERRQAHRDQLPAGQGTGKRQRHQRRADR